MGIFLYIKNIKITEVSHGNNKEYDLITVMFYCTDLSVSKEHSYELFLLPEEEQTSTRA